MKDKELTIKLEDYTESFNKITTTTDKLIESLYSLKEKEKSLIKRCNELDSFNETEEIIKLENIINSSIYILSDKQKESIKQFKEKHNKTCGNKKYTTVSYIITPTHVETFFEIICNTCRVKEDITYSK